MHVEQAESLMSHSDNNTVTDGMESELPHRWGAWGGLCWVPFNTAESWSVSIAALQPHKGACASTRGESWESPLPCTQCQPGHRNTKLSVQEGDKVFGPTKYVIRTRDA